jgi:Spy/CpxP family protein refolding chaperone
MKKLLASAVLLFGLFMISNAQVERKNNKPPHSGHEKGMMMKELNLTDAQKAQMKTLHEDFKKSMESLNKDESITLKDYRDKKEALHKQMKANMEGILTPEQKQKAEQLKKDRQAEREQEANLKLEKMKMRLGLTDDQVTNIKADRKDFHQKMMAIKENENLSRSERKEQMTALKEQNKDGIKKFLTPEQIKKMEAAKEAKKARMDKKGK